MEVEWGREWGDVGGEGDRSAVVPSTRKRAI